MQETTNITSNKGGVLTFNSYMEVKKALLLAREQGLTGRLEIKHLLSEDLQEYTLSLYFINEENKIVGCVYPYNHLHIKFLLNQAIATKTK